MKNNSRWKCRRERWVLSAPPVSLHCRFFSWLLVWLWKAKKKPRAACMATSRQVRWCQSFFRCFRLFTFARYVCWHDSHFRSFYSLSAPVSVPMAGSVGSVLHATSPLRALLTVRGIRWMDACLNPRRRTWWWLWVRSANWLEPLIVKMRNPIVNTNYYYLKKKKKKKKRKKTPCRSLNVRRW